MPQLSSVDPKRAAPPAACPPRRGRRATVPWGAALLILFSVSACMPRERVTPISPPAEPPSPIAENDRRESERRPPAPVTIAPPAPEPAPPIHVVQPGETLWRIARRYGVPLDELAARNGLADPRRIGVGQRLLIPGAGAPAAPAEIIERSPPDVRGVGDGGLWSWPVYGRISSRFGAPRGHAGDHAGIDILVPTGTPIGAAREGQVRFAGRRRGYGNLVVIDHDGEYASYYAHNSENLVRVGETVRGGQIIARSGATGNATAPHLHFELRRGRRALDPLELLPVP